MACRHPRSLSRPHALVSNCAEGEMRNPFTDAPDAESEERELVWRAQAGNREALEHLITRHQGWINNIALRMVHLPEDAEDATQEILIKVITKLSTFEGRSRFSTWLYRLVVNHVLNLKRGRGRRRLVVPPLRREPRRHAGHGAARPQHGSGRSEAFGR